MSWLRCPRKYRYPIYVLHKRWALRIVAKQSYVVLGSVTIIQNLVGNIGDVDQQAARPGLLHFKKGGRISGLRTEQRWQTAYAD